jgi:hypothetical protein
MSGTMTPGKKMVDNSLNPAWREAVVHLITSQSWNDSLPDSVAAETYDRITNEKGYLLRQIAPDSGAYYNEVCFLQVDPETCGSSTHTIPRKGGSS